MEPEYMPLYTSASDLDLSPTGTHLQQTDALAYECMSQWISICFGHIQMLLHVTLTARDVHHVIWKQSKTDKLSLSTCHCILVPVTLISFLLGPTYKGVITQSLAYYIDNNDGQK